jgi:ribosomal protein S12 methylthiotransferase accessory factor
LAEEVARVQATDRDPELGLLESLVSPFGPIAGLRRLATAQGRGLGGLAVMGAAIGSGSPGFPPVGSVADMHWGIGRTMDDAALARLVAIAEGAERYAAGDFLGECRILSSAGELDGPALDLNRIPRCSERELDTPGCPLRRLEPGAPIRWVQGIDLVTGQPTWVPAVMASYCLRGVLPSERFWYRISTGFAVHFDPKEALIRGICEVIERDSIALLWLQRLQLPVISGHCLSPVAQCLLDWSDRHFIDSYLFDATTDLGVPTVYCLQIAEYDGYARQVAGAGCARDIATAAEKALLEAIASRPMFTDDAEIKEDFTKFSDIKDGALYMARREMASAFGFLLDSARERTGPERDELPQDPAEALAWIISALDREGMQVAAVDRTPRELRAVGLTAVNVIIPDLQPMTLHPLAQYRAHPRLYKAPMSMGYFSHSEENLNPCPQPFH